MGIDCVRTTHVKKVNIELTLHESQRIVNKKGCHVNKVDMTQLNA
jgi:hypothetical protein